MLIDFYGKLKITGGTTFSNNRGIRGSKVMNGHLIDYESKEGYRNRLLGFQFYTLTFLQLDGVRFIGNRALNVSNPHNRPELIRPRLFDITSDDFYEDWNDEDNSIEDYLVIKNIEI